MKEVEDRYKSKCQNKELRNFHKNAGNRNELKKEGTDPILLERRTDGDKNEGLEVQGISRKIQVRTPKEPF